MGAPEVRMSRYQWCTQPVGIHGLVECFNMFKLIKKKMKEIKKGWQCFFVVKPAKNKFENILASWVK